MKLEMDVGLNGLNKDKDLHVLKARKVLWESMLKMKRLAQQRAPSDTGALKSRIHLVPNFKGSTSYELFDGVEYGVHVEFGTDPHLIKVKNKMSLSDINSASPKRNNAVYGKEVWHPGTTMQPYMRPAEKEVNEIWLPIFWKKEFGS